MSINIAPFYKAVISGISVLTLFVSLIITLLQALPVQPAWVTALVGVLATGSAVLGSFGVYAVENKDKIKAGVSALEAVVSDVETLKGGVASLSSWRDRAHAAILDLTTAPVKTVEAVASELAKVLGEAKAVPAAISQVVADANKVATEAKSGNIVSAVEAAVTTATDAAQAVAPIVSSVVAAPFPAGPETAIADPIAAVVAPVQEVVAPVVAQVEAVAAPVLTSVEEFLAAHKIT